jgi:hypothetical protein
MVLKLHGLILTEHGAGEQAIRLAACKYRWHVWQVYVIFTYASQ